MHTVLPKWAVSTSLIVFGFLVLSSANLLGTVGIEPSNLRLATSAASGAILLSTFIFAGVHRLWPWRVLWRLIPPANRALFPDLNGVWVGTALSNWPAIDKLRGAASRGEKLNLDDLSEIGLLPSPLVVQIRANIFGVWVKSVQKNTSSSSRSLSASVRRDKDHELFLLTYTYNQVTPEPGATDEGEHLGAAMLEFEFADLRIAEGYYWTRRCWVDGRNTAGRLNFRKVSDNTNLSDKQLRGFLAQTNLSDAGQAGA
jgi:hypothetical protein